MSVFLHQLFYNNTLSSDLSVENNISNLGEVLTDLHQWALPYDCRPYMDNTLPPTLTCPGVIAIPITENTSPPAPRVVPCSEVGKASDRNVLSAEDKYTQSSDNTTTSTLLYNGNHFKNKISTPTGISHPATTNVSRRDMYTPQRLTQLRLSMFQCIFILHYGYSEFLRVGNRIQNRELEEKQKIMDVLSKTPKRLKEGNHKLTNDNIQEILSGLYVSAKEEMMQLVAYSVYYNRIIYVVFMHSYLVVSPTKDSVVNEENINTVCILHQTRKHPKYGGSYNPDLEPTIEKIQNIHNTKIHLEHYAKPFKGISSYKTAELEQMAEKINVLTRKQESGTFPGVLSENRVQSPPNEQVKRKKTKKELYDSIVSVCCSGICS
jgi:hypothetical protein